MWKRTVLTTSGPYVTIHLSCQQVTAASVKKRRTKETVRKMLVSETPFVYTRLEI